MRSLAEILESQASHQKNNDLQINTPPRLNARSKQQLAELLGQTCALQKAYGKTAEELETLVEGFSWALAEYPIDEITLAMAHYIKTASDIPAPADIIKIIERSREIAKIKQPDIETLKRYKAKGIPLSQEQERFLNG